MVKLSWSKLEKKQKDYLYSLKNKLFLMASYEVDTKKIAEIIEMHEKKYELIIIGLFNEKYLEGFEGSSQFLSMQTEKFNESEKLNEEEKNSEEEREKEKECVVNNEKKLLIIDKKQFFQKENILFLEYSYKDTKYVIRELKPDKVIAFNGSWKNALQYNAFYWEILENKIEFLKESPFASEDEAIYYGNSIYAIEKGKIDGKISKKESVFNKRELYDLCGEIKSLSWDWTGQTGACLVMPINENLCDPENDFKVGYSKNKKKGETKNSIKKKDCIGSINDEALYKIISWGFNEVIPYQAYMRHNGSLRELEKAEIGKNIELGNSIHAEMSCLASFVSEENVLKEKSFTRKKSNKVDLKKCELWVTKFPCPYCASVLSKIKLKKICFFEDYPNDYGYFLLQKSGISLEKVGL